MATETSPRPLQGEHRSPEGHRRAAGLTPVSFLYDADGNWLVPPFPLFEVERPEPTAVQPHPRRPGHRLFLWTVGALLAPFLVVLAALSLPVSAPVRGVAIAAGWVLLGGVARWVATRRRRRQR